MGNERPVFVVGCPRSGTTMLQLMLHAHPRIAIPPETRFLLRAYADRARYGDLADPANRRRLAEWITTGKTSFADLGLDPAATVEEIAAAAPTLGSALGTVFQAYARRFGKARWGDKRPAYLNNLDVVRRLFPDAQIVNIVRDGRDCIASIRETPWYDKDVCHAISDWARAMDSSARARRILPADSYHELRYEELVAEPEQVLRQLCAFLGEPYDPAMAEPARVAEVAVPSRKSWHRLTREPVTSQRVGSWRERLQPWEIALCEAVAGRHLAAQGYQLSVGIPSVWHGPALAHRLHYPLRDAPRWTLPTRRLATELRERFAEPESLAYQAPGAAPVLSR
ncbi:sulfotransferase [Catellatospora sp. TT07R-123]|uniref:sulfotransferase family protein n=1 Tax=Catellatospora sp. TT07R-123 TaxID=2733863 RepID=UPI001B27984A|nr:sulfotransferase [Catellatospora sp. TT07R-123]GHJ50154.1 sulfotransferase [Catellatospora sp. TT07R-123]